MLQLYHLYSSVPSTKVWQTLNVQQSFHLLFGTVLWNLIEADCCRNALISLLCHSPLGQCSWVSLALQHWGKYETFQGGDGGVLSVCAYTVTVRVCADLLRCQREVWIHHACSTVSRCQVITHRTLSYWVQNYSTIHIPVQLLLLCLWFICQYRKQTFTHTTSLTSNIIAEIFPLRDNHNFRRPDSSFTMAFGHNRCPCSMITMSRLTPDFRRIFVIKTSTAEAKRSFGVCFVTWFSWTEECSLKIFC